MYILDTNTLVYFLRGQDDVVKHLLKKDPQNIFIPTVVVYELSVGSKTSKTRLKQVEEFLERFQILPFGISEAKEATKIRLELEEKGEMIGPLDILIAGTVIANRKILVTHNTKEFQRIDGLQIEDWYA